MVDRQNTSPTLCFFCQKKKIIYRLTVGSAKGRGLLLLLCHRLALFLQIDPAPNFSSWVRMELDRSKKVGAPVARWLVSLFFYARNRDAFSITVARTGRNRVFFVCERLQTFFLPLPKPGTFRLFWGGYGLTSRLSAALAVSFRPFTFFPEKKAIEAPTAKTQASKKHTRAQHRRGGEHRYLFFAGVIHSSWSAKPLAILARRLRLRSAFLSGSALPF